MNRTSLKDLMRSKEPLPEDINREVEKAASDIFKDEKALEVLEKWKDKKLYNKVSISNEQKGIAMECTFRGGIITNYHLLKRVETKEGNYIVEDRNILNSKVTQN
jgi:hypothetical protein